MVHFFLNQKTINMQPTSKQTVTKMREEYEKTIRKISSENLKRKFPDRPWIEDASSTWVSRKELEELLNANNADGLRIYYGCQHEKAHDDPKLDYEGLHTLIFVATKDSIDPKNPSALSSVDQLKDIPLDSKEITGYVGVAGTETLPCPPHCPLPPTPSGG